MVGFAMILVAALLLADPTADQPILWRDIRVGMTTSELEDLYPPVKGTIAHKEKRSIIENVQQIGRCHPDVYVEHPSGRVTKIVIYSRYRGFPKESCGDEAANALLAKYGKPLASDEDVQETGGVIKGGLFKGLDTTRNERDTKDSWIKDGVLVTFERSDPEVDDIWSITYEPADSLGL